MIGKTNAGGGGTGALLINVVGGLTRPVNPTYGTVWLKTDVPINGWEIFPVMPTWGSGEGHVYLQNIPADSGEIPNFSVINYEKKPHGLIWERIVCARQMINGKWVRLNGAMWRDGIWTPFFDATINITYPVGSVCTATDGVTTLTAPDTSGTWKCVVPNAGTWTARESAKGFSDSVSINSSGDSAKLDVTKLWLYKNGDLRTDNTGGWNATGWTTEATTVAGVLDSNRIKMYGASGKNTVLATNKKVSFSGLSTLIVDCNMLSIAGGNALTLSTNNAKGNVYNTRYGHVSSSVTGKQQLKLSISGNDSAYICMIIGGNVNNKSEIFRIWAE